MCRKLGYIMKKTSIFKFNSFLGICGSILPSMAPRRRKMGLRRLDAAYDHLMPLGFPKWLIYKTIRRLLAVYGGKSGWVFIEEACYKVVIDTILEQQQNEGEENEMIEGEGEDADTTRETSNQLVVDAAETSLHPEHISDGLLSGSTEIPLISDREYGRDDELPAATDGDATPSVVSVMTSYTRPSSTTENAEPCHLQESNQVVRQRRPPTYGWISESESEEEE